MTLKHDGEIRIATAPSRKSVKWKPETLLWSAFVERLSTPTRTQETVAEYKAMPKAQRDERKDVGGYLGGSLRGGRRKADAVLCRSIVTLDMDNLRPCDDPWGDVFLLGCAAVLYSTHSHTPEAPRLRLLFPLSRPATPDEYGAISRWLGGQVGIDLCDDTTFSLHQLMYWPSCPRDGVYRFEVQDGQWLDVDAVLASYSDWRDAAQWPVSSRKAEVIRKLAKKQGDPCEKPGLIGAFCRAYSISAAIATFLPDVYTPCDEGRYTYAQGTAAGGLVLYDGDTFAFSHHATDPCGERLVNAFDLVRLHLYGGKDDEIAPDTPVNKLPSFMAMCDKASQDGEVKAELAKSHKKMLDEFDDPGDWRTLLEYDKKGNLKDTLDNLVLILRHDENLKSISFNQHRDGIAVREAVPWEQLKTGWGDADQATLLTYISAEYRLHSPGKTRTALLAVAAERKFHPVRDFFNELPPWDGTARLDTLLVVFLGAEDTPYVRAVTRKTLVAAVARTLEPGRKFDTALTFVGPRKIGKSTLYAKLGGKWYVESLSLSDMHDGKRAAEKLQGCLIQEMAELTGMKKADIETIKAFLSRADDVYRASYGMNVENHPRQCVIVGSTNNDEGFLRDITGNRNFWVVKVTGQCPRRPWDITPDEVSQVWAEALHYYKQGEQLHLPPELEDMAEAAQDAMMEADERTGMVQQYLDRLLPSNWVAMQPFDRQQWLDGCCFGGEELGTEQRAEVCNAELWVECFGKRFSDMKKADSYDLKAIMRGIPEWERQKELKRFGCYGPQRYYKRVKQGG